MKEKLCPKCGLQLKFIPEGVSKNKKRYNAFFSCTKECGYSENVSENESRRLSLEYQFIKDKQIAYFNSVNGAIEMVDKNEPRQGLEESLRTWRDFFYQEWSAWYIKNIINEVWYPVQTAEKTLTLGIQKTRAKTKNTPTRAVFNANRYLTAPKPQTPL